MTTPAPSARFSDELLTLARPVLLWSAEQADLFNDLLPQSGIRWDPAAGQAVYCGIPLRAHQIGSLDLDHGTWRWAWADESVAGTPGGVRAAELRRIGTEKAVPELTADTVDLGGFPEPLMAGTALLMTCLGLLDARGSLMPGRPGEPVAFLLVDDPAVPVAQPRAGRLERALDLVRSMPVPALKLVQGWCGRHGIDPEYAPGRVLGPLPDGDRFVVTLDGPEFGGVRLTGADGGPPAGDGIPRQTLAADRVQAPDPRIAGAGDSQETARSRAEHLNSDSNRLPQELLTVAARHIALSIRGTRGMIEYAGKDLGFVGAMPEWDRTGGLLRFPDGALRVRELGRYDLDEGWFEWADGTEDVRDAFRRTVAKEAGDPGLTVRELEPGRLDLSPYPKPESVAVVLARSAAQVAGGAFTSLGNQFLLVSDDRLPEPGTDPNECAAEVEAGASWLTDLVPPATRAATMRTVATAYFDHFDFVTQGYGMPDFISGTSGLYEVRVYFAHDGTVTNTTVGMAFTGQPL